MLKYKIYPLIEQTAKDLNMDPGIVKAVIMHEFKVIQQNVISPSFLGIRMEDFGKFYFKHKQYVEVFPEIKRKYRLGKFTPEVLSKYLSLRAAVSAYRQHRKYKVRFGSWH
jgi:hypothetical protein